MTNSRMITLILTVSGFPFWTVINEASQTLVRQKEATDFLVPLEEDRFRYHDTDMVHSAPASVRSFALAYRVGPTAVALILSFLIWASICIVFPRLLNCELWFLSTRVQKLTPSHLPRCHHCLWPHCQPSILRQVLDVASVWNLSTSMWCQDGCRCRSAVHWTTWTHRCLGLRSEFQALVKASYHATCNIFKSTHRAIMDQIVDSPCFERKELVNLLLCDRSWFEERLLEWREYDEWRK